MAVTNFYVNVSLVESQAWEIGSDFENYRGGECHHKVRLSSPSAAPRARARVCVSHLQIYACVLKSERSIR